MRETDELAKLKKSLAAIHCHSGRFLIPNWQELALKDTICTLRAIHEECEYVLPILSESKIGILKSIEESYENFLK